MAASAIFHHHTLFLQTQLSSNPTPLPTNPKPQIPKKSLLPSPTCELPSSSSAYRLPTTKLNQKTKTKSTSSAHLGFEGRFAFDKIALKVSFIDIIRHYTEFRMVDEALGVIKEMMASGIKLSTQCYNLVLNFLVDENRPKMVESLYFQMRCGGVKPDVRTFTILIKALCKANQMGSALGLLKQMSFHYELTPNAITYGTLINGFCNHGKLGEATRLMEEMTEGGSSPTTVTYNTIINGFCKQGRLEEATSLLENMPRRGCQPNIVTYSTIIDGFCKQDRLEEATSLLGNMFKRGYQSDIVTFTILIDEFCKQGRFKDASRLMDKMYQTGFRPDVVTYSAIINVLCKARELQKAEEIFEEMLKAGIEPNVVTYTVLMCAMLKEGRVEEAFDIYNVLTSKGHAPDGYTHGHNILHGLCKDGSLNVAMEFIDRMLAKGCIADKNTSNVLIERLHREGRWDQAMHLSRELEAKE